MANEPQRPQQGQQGKPLVNGGGPAPSFEDRFREMEARMVELASRNAALAQQLAQQQGPRQNGNMQNAPILEPTERERWAAQKAVELGRPCIERTQEEARRQFPEETEFPIGVADMPEIFIPAIDKDQALSRYNRLCGITFVDPDKHTYKIGPAVKRQVAQVA